MKKTKFKPLVFKPYKPDPHPMQHRLNEFRAIPSLWCGEPYYVK